VQNILGLTGIGSNLDRRIWIGRLRSGWRLGRQRWTLAASSSGGGLIEKLRKHDSSHDFNSGLAWEKENEEGNMFRGL
jgi:hypothetical protein